MTLIDFFATRYQFGYGENDARTIRRKTKETIGIFGRGRATSEEPFKPLSAVILLLVSEARKECGPCSRADVVAAVHRAADAAELAEMRARKDSR